MQVKFVCFFLLGTSFIQGNITVSNSPNSPHRKLSDLTEDVSVLKQEVKTIQSSNANFNEILKKISNNETQQAQLKSENEVLKSEINNLKKLCENLSTQPKELEQKIQQLQTENNTLKVKLQALETNNKNQEVSTLETMLADLQSELNEFKNTFKNTPNSLAKLQSDNETTTQKLQNIESINTQIEELGKNLSSIKNTTDNLTMSRENIEKYLQEFYAEISDKFKQFEQSNAQKTEQKQITDEEFKEINQKIENFLGKYQKLDTFNDILVSFQEDLSLLKDSSFSLNVSQKNLEKDFKTFSDKTYEQIKNIQKAEVEKDAYKDEAIKNQMSEFKKDLINKCENICQKVVNQTNDRLQNLVQQVQTKVDSIRSRTFSKHTILSGESLNSIAKRYSTSPEQILITNNIKSARDLRVGDTIIVPNNL